MPSKVTFECTALKGVDEEQNIDPNRDIYSQLKPDTEKSVVYPNHKLAGRVYRGILFGLFALGMYGIHWWMNK